MSVPTAIAETPLPCAMVGIRVNAPMVIRAILMFKVDAKISTNANAQNNMLAMVFARIHQEALFANATLAIQEMLQPQMHAQKAN